MAINSWLSRSHFRVPALHCFNGHDTRNTSMLFIHNPWLSKSRTTALKASVVFLRPSMQWPLRIWPNGAIPPPYRPVVVVVAVRGSFSNCTWSQRLWSPRGQNSLSPVRFWRRIIGKAALLPASVTSRRSEPREWHQSLTSLRSFVTSPLPSAVAAMSALLT